MHNLWVAFALASLALACPAQAQPVAGCTSQEFKDAEQAAYRALVADQAHAAQTAAERITNLERYYKEKVATASNTYNTELNRCGGKASCSPVRLKMDYDAALAKERTAHDAALRHSQDEEVVMMKDAKEKYDAAVEKARRLYCKDRRLSFKGVTLTMRMRGAVTQTAISGSVCGEPVSDNWQIVVTNSIVSPIRQTKTDPPFRTDCLLAGSSEAKDREKILLDSPGGYVGWYCIYQPAVRSQPARINIRMPKLKMTTVGISFDAPKDHVVDVIDEGECNASTPP